MAGDIPDDCVDTAARAKGGFPLGSPLPAMDLGRIVPIFGISRELSTALRPHISHHTINGSEKTKMGLELKSIPSPILNRTQATLAVDAALESGTAPFGLPAAVMKQHGSMTMFFYTPLLEDFQPVHDQDEVYVVVSGQGHFAIGDRERLIDRFAFGPGDAIFVPAGAQHRFEDFSDDFATWVVMYGREGGETRSGMMQDYGERDEG